MSLSGFQRRRREQAAAGHEAVEKVAEEQHEEKPLDKMKVEELREYAEKHSIDIGEATKKHDILEIILKSIGGGENAGS